MEWKERLFVGRKAKERLAELIEKIEAARFVPDLYLITLSASPLDQLDIVCADQIIGHIRRNHFRCLPPIVGIALGKGEALSVVARIASTSVTEGAGGDLRMLFEDTWITKGGSP